MAVGVGLCAGRRSADEAESSAAANHSFSDRAEGFRFTSSGGLSNPDVVVAFQPCTGPSALSAGRHLAGGGTRTQISSPWDAGQFRFLIGLMHRGDPRWLPLPPAPNADGVTGQSFLLGGTQFAVSFGFSGAGRVRDWAPLQSGPDLAGDFIGARFRFLGGGAPVASFRILEEGRPLTLVLAGEPHASARALRPTGLGELSAILRSPLWPVRRTSLASC
jgi:hypothetical protein